MRNPPERPDQRAARENRERMEATQKRKEKETREHRERVEADARRADARRDAEQKKAAKGGKADKSGGCVVLILVPTVAIGLLTLAKVWFG